MEEDSPGPVPERKDIVRGNKVKSIVRGKSKWTSWLKVTPFPNSLFTINFAANVSDKMKSNIITVAKHFMECTHMAFTQKQARSGHQVLYVSNPKETHSVVGLLSDKPTTTTIAENSPAGTITHETMHAWGGKFVVFLSSARLLHLDQMK